MFSHDNYHNFHDYFYHYNYNFHNFHNCGPKVSQLQNYCFRQCK